MHFILLNDWHVARREKQNMGVEIWRIILDIDDLKEGGDARMMVTVVMMRFQDDSDDNDNKNNTEVVSSDVEVSGCE